MKKFRVTFDENRCKGCSLCIEVCPKDILVLNETKSNAKGYYPSSIVDMDACIGCMSCALMCPDVVIEIERIGD